MDLIEACSVSRVFEHWVGGAKTKLRIEEPREWNTGTQRRTKKKKKRQKKKEEKQRAQSYVRGL